MSTIKVDTYLTRGGASEIAIDKLKGASSAGSMTVVGEGGSTTTNLQQGLAKARCSTNAAGTTIHGSFNVSSLTDFATGKQVLNLSSSFANTNYTPICGVGNKDDGDARETMIRSVATGSYRTNIYSQFTSAFIDGATSSTAHGDLA